MGTERIGGRGGEGDVYGCTDPGCGCVVFVVRAPERGRVLEKLNCFCGQAMIAYEETLVIEES
jgi:hypothetical protein